MDKKYRAGCTCAEVMILAGISFFLVPELFLLMFFLLPKTDVIGTLMCFGLIITPFLVIVAGYFWFLRRDTRAIINAIREDEKLDYEMRNYEAAVRGWYYRFLGYGQGIDLYRKLVAQRVVRNYAPTLVSEIKVYCATHKRMEKETKRERRALKNSGFFENSDIQQALGQSRPDMAAFFSLVDRYPMMKAYLERLEASDNTVEFMSKPYMVLRKKYDRDPLEFGIFDVLVNNLAQGEVVICRGGGCEFYLAKLHRAKDGMAYHYAISRIKASDVPGLAKKAAEADVFSLPAELRGTIKQENVLVYEQLKNMNEVNCKQVLRLKKPHPRIASAKFELENGLIDQERFDLISNAYA